MKVSVIVPTYNGRHKIMGILNALAKQRCRDFELIVVIDGSTDGTAELLKEQMLDFAEFRIIEQPNGGRAKVRNRGAAEASGELLIFFDDDMRPQENAVCQHIDHHAAHPGSIMTGGQVEEIVENMPDFLRFKAHLSRKWAQGIQATSRPLTKEQIFMTAANCSIAKSTFTALGGFDERLTDAEDYDLAVRATKQDIPLYSDPSIQAWHEEHITCGSYIRRLRQYAKAQEKLQALKPELYGASHKYAVQKPEGMKATFFKLFCSPLWIRSIDKNRLTFLPAGLRYKLYDWVVTANGSFYPEKVPL